MIRGKYVQKVPQNCDFAHLFTRKYFIGLSHLYEQTICLDNSLKKELGMVCMIVY